MTPPNPPTLDLEGCQLTDLEKRARRFAEAGHQHFHCELDVFANLIAAARELERVKAALSVSIFNRNEALGEWRRLAAIVEPMRDELAEAQTYHAELAAANARIRELEELLDEALTCGMGLSAVEAETAEACAKMCDKPDGYWAKNCAAAIRARFGLDKPAGGEGSE